jgi:hypothetical protein
VFYLLLRCVYGLWFMVYGLWFMVYGLWFMVYGFVLSPATAGATTRLRNRALSSTGQLHSHPVYAPPPLMRLFSIFLCHAVAAQVALEESKRSARVFTMGQGAGSRVATRRFQAPGSTGFATCTQPPPHEALSEVGVAERVLRVRVPRDLALLQPHRQLLGLYNEVGVFF